LTSSRTLRSRLVSYGRQCCIRLRVRIARRFCTLRGYLFDARYGTDTIGRRENANPDIDPEAQRSMRQYQASKIGVFHHIIRNLALSWPDYAFVDFGCGKGLCLMLAAQYGFRRCIGVEISARLSAIAEQNTSFFGRKSKTNSTFDIRCMDARHYPIPQGRTVLYFYNPFDSEVMCAVLANVQRALEESPREIVVIYVVPAEADVFEKADFLSLKGTGEFRGDHYRVYSSAEARVSRIVDAPVTRSLPVHPLPHIVHR
jgi:SAM-dependent methyltransferase